MPDIDQLDRPTRIAILGGGLAGATAAIALNKLKNVQVTVFDQARELREVGASVGIQTCAMQCFDKLGLSADVEKIAYRHGDEPLPSRLWSTNEIIPNPHPQPSLPVHHRMARFYRVHLHQLLISKIPASSIHLSKRLKGIKLRPDDIVITFEDESEFICDAVVGADGIRSTVRKIFYPDYKISSGDSVTLRGVFPSSHLDGIEGVPQESSHYAGPDRHFFTTPLSNGLFTVVAFLPLSALRGQGSKTSEGTSSNKPYEWDQKLAVSLHDYYSDWHPTIAQITERTPAVHVYPDYNGPALPSLVLGDERVVLIGDAGHPHGGAYAAGGTLSIEDAYTLYRSLSAASERQKNGGRLDRDGIKWAFRVFNEARLAQVNRVVDAANKLRAGRKATRGILLSDEELIERGKNRVDLNWLAYNDTDEAFRRAVESLDAGRPS